MHETRSAAQVAFLEKEGFRVQRGVATMRRSTLIKAIASTLHTPVIVNGSDSE